LPTSEFEIIKKEVSANITEDMYNEEQWNDYVQTTGKLTDNIFNILDLPNLESMVNNHAKKFLKGIGQSKKFYVYNSWFNRLPKYGHQGTHTHHDYDVTCFSGIYYYQETNSKMKPVTFFVKNDMLEQRVSYEYKAGRIIIFSSRLPHRVSFNKNDEMRTSFAFNFKTVD
jgi:hypothetical protein